MPRTLGESLGLLRRARGKNQRTVSIEMGVSQGLLSHYEHDTREPSLSFIIKACEYYGVTADFLLGRSKRQVGTETGAQLREIAAELKKAVEKLESLAEDVEK